MAPDYWSMGSTLARAEIAVVLSMARAASGYAQATLRFGGGIGRRVLGLLDRANRSGQSGLDPPPFEGCRAYLRELGGVTRVSAITFVEVLEGSRPGRQWPKPQAVESPQAPTRDAVLDASTYAKEQ